MQKLTVIYGRSWKPISLLIQLRTLSHWSHVGVIDGETLQSFTVQPDTDFAILVGVPAEDEPGKIGFFLEGVAVGRCQVHINYSTATRSDCATVTVVVSSC